MKLPQPFTPSEHYLCAILEELKKITDEEPQVTDSLEDGTVTVELKESSPVDAKIEGIPQSFPGYNSLTEANIFFMHLIPRTEKELTSIKGIGATKAQAILAELGISHA